MSLRREDLAAEGFDVLLQQLVPAGTLDFLSVEAREASLQAALAGAPAGDVWLFGYGSLMWSPAIHHEGHRIALLRGWHRRFCLWTPLGRGTPEQPGLVLGLERGGACRGLAFRIDRNRAETELRLVWRREMLTAAYVPRWVTLETPGGPLRAITFVINRAGARYTGRLDETTTAAAIAGAAGHLGTCRDYLRLAVETLQSHGIEDRRMARLNELVARLNVS